ncbi:MAG: peptide deformylase [Opitutales bacterium]|nr:peptide deformylase [Opitutales bacterium]MCH8539854.1 peptide deformylase [Opitutales bacterium]
MNLRLCLYNEPILRQKGEPIKTFDHDLRDLAREMVLIMEEENGIGIAAQQVGLDRQFCIVDVRNAEEPYLCELDGKPQLPDLLMPLYLANPEITKASAQQSVFEEGCLSLPEIRGEVERPQEIVVRFQDLEGAWRQLRADGILARCIQHEIDHLNGILFIDHLPPAELKKQEKKLKRLRRETRDLLKKEK